MSTRREVILSPGCVRNVRPGVCAICWVRLEVEKPGWRSNYKKDKHRRVITLSLVVSSQGKAAWIVTDDNAAEQGCRDSALDAR